MTNPHPIAEQDSLEGLIARLRDGDDLHSRIEAADTLSQMRDAVAALADAADTCAEAPHFIVQPFLKVFRAHGETIAQCRMGTTTKIEKDAQRG